jgi:Tfp pilus assembly protein PilV
MKFEYKNLIAVVFIIAILVAVSGCTTTSNNTTNNTTNITEKNDTSNKNTTTEISATKAKEMASKYTGIGVTLGTPTLTTFNGVKVWKIPISTSGTNESVDVIYINAVNGNRVQ